LVKKVIFGFFLLVIIGIIVYFLFITNFKIFDNPAETTLKVECDYEGLRKIKMTEVSGDATANGSIHIYASDCNYEESTNLENIFVADAPNIEPSDVSFEWKGFDTLTITYRHDLRIFKKLAKSKMVKPTIIFEYITK